MTGLSSQAATRTGVRTLSLWLRVTSPRAAILGSRDKHVSLGDSLTITCELRQMEEAPDFVFWYHNNTMINYHQHVSVITTTLGKSENVICGEKEKEMIYYNLN